MSAPINSDDKSDDAYRYAPRWARTPPPPTQPDISKLAKSPPMAPDAAGFTSSPAMAPGIGSFNIDPPVVPAPFEGDRAVMELRRRLSLDPDFIPEPPALRRRERAVLRFGWLWFALLVVAFIVAILALTWLLDGNVGAPTKQDKAGIGAAPPLIERASREGKTLSSARLVVESQQGFANEPLPLGVALKDGSGEERVVLAGLAAGTALSAGTPLGLTRWQVPARDLGRAFAYAPRDFSGVMAAAVDLRSASDRLVDSQVIRLEWIKKKSAPPAAFGPRLDAMTPSAVVQPLEADELATLLRRGQEFLQTGDIASARLVLLRAANAGSAQAALALGASFDPFFLAELGVLGFAPDLARARAWYRRATEFGSSEAPRRLERLSSTEK